MNFRRILVNAVARRIAYVVVAAALAWLGLGEVRAQSYASCYSDMLNDAGGTPYYPLCPDRQAAASNAQRVVDARRHPGSPVEPCYHHSNGTYGWYQCSAQLSAVPTMYNITRGYLLADECPDGGTWNPVNNTCRAPCPSGQVRNTVTDQCQPPCTGRPQQIVTFASMIPSGSIQCHNGCEASIAPSGDGTYVRTTIQTENGQCSVLPKDCTTYGAGYFLNAVTGMCQPSLEECASNETKDPVTGVCREGCPEGMVLDSNNVCKPKENECPAGNIRAPSGECLPGDGQCAAGEARRKDGTCGRDANGDGVADSDDDDDTNDDPKETFSGGDSCNSPPSCSGGPIMCGQARIQWRIDCNTRRNVNISGGACSAMPVCTGDKCNAMEYASLLQQWRATCALEKLASRDGGEGEDGQPDWTKVTGDGTGGAGEEPDKPHRTFGLSLNMLDGGGFLGGGSCPQFGSVDLGIFGAVNLDDYDWICKFLAAVKIVMTGLGGFLAFCIIAGRGIF